MTSPAILVVEDEPTLRELMVIALEDFSGDVTAVATADDGARLLASQPWALLITDVKTPGALDGWELAWTAYRYRSDLAVVVTSGYTDKLCTELPPSAQFIAKPWAVADLLHLVEGKLVLHS